MSCPDLSREYQSLCRIPPDATLRQSRGHESIVRDSLLGAGEIAVCLFEIVSRGRSTLRGRFADGVYAEAGALSYWSFENDLAHRYIDRFRIPVLAPEPMPSHQVLFFGGGRLDPVSGRDWPLALTREERLLGAGGLHKRYLDAPIGDVIAATRVGWPESKVKPLDDTSLAQLLSGKGASPAAMELLRISGMDFVGESAEEYSALDALRYRALFRLQAGPMHQLEGGNDRLPAGFSKRLRDDLHYGAPVVRIETTGREALVTHLQGGRPRTLSAQHVVCAIHLPALRAIELVPQLSRAKQEAVRELPYTDGAFVLLQTRERIWVEGGRVLSAHTDLPVSYLMDAEPGRNRSSKRGLLRCFLVGRHARQLARLPEKERISLAVESADRVFPGMADIVEGGVSVGWTDDPWAGGSAVWFRPGQMTSLLRSLSEPEARLHFAGAHTASPLFVGFIQGALESGLRAAREVHEAA